MEKSNENVESAIKKVVVIGPESTGKSTLSSALAEHYETAWVPEYARKYINELDRPYQSHDLLEIARGQLVSENKQAQKASDILICDTNLIVIKIWSEFKFGFCHEEILKEISKREYDLYLLMDIDVPWEDDPQRENPGRRDFFYDLYKSTLESLDVPFIEISGEWQKRRNDAITAINRLLNL